MLCHCQTNTRSTCKLSTFRIEKNRGKKKLELAKNIGGLFQARKKIIRLDEVKLGFVLPKTFTYPKLEMFGTEYFSSTFSPLKKLQTNGASERTPLGFVFQRRRAVQGCSFSPKILSPVPKSLVG